MNRTKLQFSGHETFACKQSWLKKGFDYVLTGKTFADEDSVVELGVGKNMVNSIKFWLKAFDIANESGNTELGEFIFGKNGRDVYLEDVGTIWLLHHSIVTTNFASLYNLVFETLRRERTEFTKDQLHKFILTHYSQEDLNTNTINNDISVFTRMYIESNETSGEDFNIGLRELELITNSAEEDIYSQSKSNYIQISEGARDSLPNEVLLYAILSNETYGNSISFNELYNGTNSPGSIFLLDKATIKEKLVELSAKFNFLVYSETVGTRTLQFKNKPNKWEILDDYYSKR